MACDRHDVPTQPNGVCPACLEADMGVPEEFTEADTLAQRRRELEAEHDE